MSCLVLFALIVLSGTHNARQSLLVRFGSIRVFLRVSVIADAFISHSLFLFRRTSACGERNTVPVPCQNMASNSAIVEQIRRQRGRKVFPPLRTGARQCAVAKQKIDAMRKFGNTQDEGRRKAALRTANRQICNQSQRRKRTEQSNKIK